MSANKKNDLRAAMRNKEQKKTAAYAFFGEEKSNEDNNKTETEQLNVTNKQNTENKQLNVTNNKKSETEVVEADELSSDFWSTVTNKKPTVEDTHTRGTFLIQNELLERLDALAKGQKRGFKTKLVNHALKEFLDQIEKNNE
ncbi:hypothetical protein [Alkalicoccobacillus gibsonii]|uniref:hypothetical protein n=1 Tax=Alkalicoccobacillus gibsonii TaxID=79881 RepID=UPI0019344A9B|nr:hypothetical protein [Alkalicoccobacillus gibsonii]MBM0067979.1 hypothetical protein [Alkalicoccobacillus gibsonii]